MYVYTHELVILFEALNATQKHENTKQLSLLLAPGT